jgi:2-polyprenyl-3-methyl-5-hydroxy-6-metoxy-1,4-benzoquinol methylase
MANIRGKEIDNTHLSIDQAEKRGFIHRDYIAHCLRWSHVARFLGERQRYRSSDILDIGCGKDLPLLRLLYTSRLIPETGSYTGIDVNKLSLPFSVGSFPHELIGQTDVCEHDFGASTFAVITCFEVLEHVEPSHSFRILARIRSLLEDTGIAFISTPNYDQQVGAAGNHVNEMSWSALHSLINRAGLHVLNMWGTFASIRDYYNKLEPERRLLFEQLREYYDSNYLATVFAPLYPKESRNILWKLAKADPFAATVPEDQRHSSSDKWVSFAKQMNGEVNGI